MKKFAFAMIVSAVAAAVSGAAFAKDTGFSSTFPGNSAAGYNTLSPAAGSNADTQQKAPVMSKHKKKHHVKMAPASAQ